MKNLPKTLERENPSPKSNNNGVDENPSTPKPLSISETNGYPTTFIQADTSSFKQVVQLLTGSPDKTGKKPSKPAGPIRTGPNKPGFKLKLHERRISGLKNLMVNHGQLPLNSVLSSPSQPKMQTPIALDLHELILSPITPLNRESFDGSSSPPSNSSSSSIEERVIAEKGFYLHASPLATPRGSKPRLLPLFPVTSPRVS